MLKFTHFAVQLEADLWLVTFVSEYGITETTRMTGMEFAAMVAGMVAATEIDEGWLN